MEEVMISWRDRGRGGNSLDGGGVSSTTESDVSLPLGPGEWEEALGLPLCVVCQNVRTSGISQRKIITNFPDSLTALKHWRRIDPGKRKNLIRSCNIYGLFY
jgi:hypothetical protein